MKKILLICIYIILIQFGLVGCQIGVSWPDAPHEDLKVVDICKAREAGLLRAGGVFRIISSYRFVSRHEEYFSDSACERGGIDISGFDEHEGSVADFLKQRDAQCRIHGQADFCVTRASIDATVQAVDSGDGHYLLRVLRVHRADWSKPGRVSPAKADGI